MAARINLRQDEQCRSAIQTTQLVKRLQENALGTLEITQQQQKSIEILLRKTLPDLQAITISGDEENPLSVSLAAAGSSVESKLKRLIESRADDPESKPD
jgi:hypothetical protein